jgi:hypothetical protein
MLSIWSRFTNSQLTSTPGLSRGLMTSLLTHSIRLPLVLGHSSVDAPINPSVFAIAPAFLCEGLVLDNVRANWCLEDIGERLGILRSSAIGTNDGDSWSARHGCCFVLICCRRRPQDLRPLWRCEFQASSANVFPYPKIARR